MSFAHLITTARGLGGITRAIADPEPEIPPDVSDALIHWELNEASGSTADNIGTLGATADGTIAGTVDYALPSLITGVGTGSLGVGPDGRVQRAHVAGLAVSSATLAIYGQADSIPAAGTNRVIVAKDWIGEPGGISMEVYADGSVLRARAYHRNAAGTVQFIGSSTGTGTIPLHTGFLYVLRIINGAETSIWLRIAGGAMVKQPHIGSGAGLASNDLPLRVGCYLTEPAGAATDTAFFIGLMKRFQFWGRALTDVEIAALPAPISAVTFDGFDAGTLTENTTGSILVSGTTRPSTGYVCHVDSQPSDGTVISEPGGSSWGYDTNPAALGADSFTGHIEAGGSSSPVQTIDFSVAAAPTGGITLAAMTAFTPSRQQVTALAGWPVGRTPKRVSVQSNLCKGYVRRSWKLTANDGTWMDFQPGWRKGSGTITIVLDNDTLVNVAFTINHTIPTPGSGGVTRTLDALGGGNFTSWSAAVAGCAANDVLVVRARAGGEMYTYDSQTGGATSTVNGVKVVAHPDDLAAGRRPRVHIWGTKFARYCDDLNNGHWEVFENLGGVHGTIYRTTATLGSSLGNNIGCSYRSKGGGLKRAWTYTNTPSTPGGLARLRDVTYPRVRGELASSGGTVAGDMRLYMWPGIYHHSDDRLYIRLSPITNSVGAKCVNASAGVGPNPPWNWVDDDPASPNPNLVELYISATGNLQAVGTDPTTGMNYGIRLNDRSNWLIENIDFVTGGNGFEVNRSTNITLRGCRVLGWAPSNMSQDAVGTNTAARCHNMLEAKNADGLVLDTCEFWGGQPSNMDFEENKLKYGAYALSGKPNLFFFSTDRTGTLQIRFLNCIIEGFPTPTRQAGNPTWIKFHQCEMRYWGMDGAIVSGCASQNLDYIRTRFYEGTLSGYAGEGSPLTFQGTTTLAYNLMVNVRPFVHLSSYWNTASPNNNEYMCACPHIPHGNHVHNIHHFYFNNTVIGAHNHRYSNCKKNAGGNVHVTHDGGGGSYMAPHGHNHQIRNFGVRNNICAVFPNGSLGSSPNAWGPGRDSHAGLVLHANHIGFSTTVTLYTVDHNMYHRASGMPTLGGDSFNGVVTTVNSGGTETARTTIGQVQSDTGQEANGRIANPLFVGTWDATQPDSVLHSVAHWCLQSGSPAITGGDPTNRTWRDLDFGTETTYGGNTWLGCMDPLSSAVEQQVGPLGPMPGEL